MKQAFALALILLMTLSLFGCAKEESITILYGESALVLPDKACDAPVWESSDPGIVTVDNGLATGVGPGEATVTITDGSKTLAVYTVHVELVEIAEVFLDQVQLTLDVDSSAQLQYTLLPSDASDYGLTFTSANPNIASVEQDGTVTGRSAGTTRIILSTQDNITSVCEVTVNEKSAIEQLNAHETEMFNFLTNHMLPSFYDPSAARLREIWYFTDETTGEPKWGFMWIELQGSNRLGGTVFKQYMVLPGSNTYYELEKYITDADTTFIKADPDLISYAKINAALEEYWSGQFA